MKIALKILGVLLLLGGLGIGGMLATSNVGTFEKEAYESSLMELTKAEKELELSKGSFDEPEKLKKAESWRKSADLSEKAVETRKRDALFGYLASGVLIVLGIALFGISFVIGKKKV